MSLGSRVASALVLVALAAAPLIAAQRIQDPDTVRLITVQYADGRIARMPVRDTGWGTYTTAFPRIPGAATVDNGLALDALQIEYTIDKRDVVASVALRYGTPHQKVVPVTSVRLTDGGSVRVDDLTAFGVRPITLAMISVPRPQLPIPAGSTPSSQLEIAFDVEARGAPQYRISITNHAQQGVMAFAFESYHGSSKGPYGRKSTPAHTPLIPPGETYALTLFASPNDHSASSSDFWLLLDRFVITSITWSDGIVDGDARPAAEKQVVDDGTALQLARALTLMRGAEASRGFDLQQLREAVGSLSIDEAPATSLSRLGMQSAKNALLKDFDEFLRDPRSSDAGARRAWLTSTVAKFDGWRTRIVTAPR